MASGVPSGQYTWAALPTSRTPLRALTGKFLKEPSPPLAISIRKVVGVGAGYPVPVEPALLEVVAAADIWPSVMSGLANAWDERLKMREGIKVLKNMLVLS